MQLQPRHRPIPKIVPDTVIDHVDEPTEFDAGMIRRFAAGSNDRLPQVSDEATALSPPPIPSNPDDTATVLSPPPAEIEDAATLISLRRWPADDIVATAVDPTPPANKSRKVRRRTKPVATTRPAPEARMAPLPAPVARDRSQPAGLPTDLGPYSSIAPRRPLSPADIGPFTHARVSQAIPMLHGLPSNAIVFAPAPGSGTERVLPAAHPHARSHRVPLSIGIVAAAMLGVLLGFLLVGSDDGERTVASTPSAPIVTVPVAAPAPTPIEPVTAAAPEIAEITEITVAAVAEPRTESEAPVVASVVEAPARTAPARRPAKPRKKATTSRRHRPFRVDTSTPLGTLRVSRL